MNSTEAARPVVTLGPEALTVAQLVAIGHGRADVAMSEAGWQAVRAARAVVDEVVARNQPAYGITTGVGSQKDFVVSQDEISRFNNTVIVAHATVAPGTDASAEMVRGALALQIALLARGQSGVRVELVESLLARLQADDLPGARTGSSVGASDIVAMSQLAVPLLGKPAVGPDRPGSGSGAGPAPIGRLAAKEALSLLNNNCLTLSGACLALAETGAALRAITWAAAMTMEGFRGNLLTWDERIDAARGQPGQSRSGAALRAALAGSRLWQAGEARFLQDPLSFRCVPQINGAAEAALGFARDTFGAELGAVCDNPLIDRASGQVLSHGNMETTVCTLALDMTRQAMAKVATASMERINKIQWPGFSGLPTGLAEEGGATGGVQFLNLAHIAAAQLSAARQAANPSLLNYTAQLADGVEDVAGSLPQAVAETERQLPALWTLAAIELVCAIWAVQRRGIVSGDLGAGLRPIHAALVPLLPIGREGEAPFDLGVVVAEVQRMAREAGYNHE